MLNTLMKIALDLCGNLAAEDRYRRLVLAVREVVPCDAVCLFEYVDGALRPVAFEGLSPDLRGRTFLAHEQPRLARILASEGTVRFRDSSLPDPFDGLVLEEPDAFKQVHACMGCSLKVDGRTVGLVTMDAFEPHAFDKVDDAVVGALGALAGAAMKTAALITALESSAKQNGLVSGELIKDVFERGIHLILGKSAAIERTRNEIEIVAGSDLPVLITGETGVGKEIAARAIHASSPRQERPIIYVNCAALPDSLAESELFGHAKGAFTGATTDRAGKFEVADGGTLFLDELGELSLLTQAKLLRVLQSGEVQRVGSDRFIRVNVRVIAATNRNLTDEVKGGRFRADLFHRLSVYPIHVPPLRERIADIDLLAGHFLGQFAKRLQVKSIRLSQGARAVFRDYAWPGNVRELEHVLLRASLNAAAGTRAPHLVLTEDSFRFIEVEDAAPSKTETAKVVPFREPASRRALSLKERSELFQKSVIEEALKENGNNQAAVARILGIDRSNLHRLIGRLGIEVPSVSSPKGKRA